MNKVELQVTVNLELALRCIRLKDRERIVRVDAICLNQDNIIERNAHVQEMGSIYGSAERVLIWLGPLGRHTELAVDYIKSIAQNSIEQTSKNEALIISLINDPTMRQTCEGITEIFGSQWWSRVWVVQEVSRARRDPLLVLGHGDVLTWTDVVRFVTHFDDYHKIPSKMGSPLVVDDLAAQIHRKLHGLRDINSIRDRTRVPPRLRGSNNAPVDIEAARMSLGNDMYYLFGITKYFRSTDPRDKIFAL